MYIKSFSHFFLLYIHKVFGFQCRYRILFHLRLCIVKEKGHIRFICYIYIVLSMHFYMDVYVWYLK